MCALDNNLISQVYLAALCNGRQFTKSWCAGRYVPRAVLMDLVSQASWLSSCSKRVLCFEHALLFLLQTPTPDP